MRSLYALARCQLWAVIAWWAGWEAGLNLRAASVQKWAADHFEQAARESIDPRDRQRREREALRHARRAAHFTGEAEKMAELHGAALMLRAAAEAERR